MRAEDVRDACVVRQAKAYPVYDEEYANNVAVIRRELRLRFPGLHLVGRNGMHKYKNQDHAMMTGMLTAANILAGETRYMTYARSTRTRNIRNPASPAPNTRCRASGWCHAALPAPARPDPGRSAEMS